MVIICSRVDVLSSYADSESLSLVSSTVHRGDHLFTSIKSSDATLTLLYVGHAAARDVDPQFSVSPPDGVSDKPEPEADTSEPRAVTAHFNMAIADAQHDNQTSRLHFYTATYNNEFLFNPLTPTVAIWVYSYKASCASRHL